MNKIIYFILFFYLLISCSPLEQSQGGKKESPNTYSSDTLSFKISPGNNLIFKVVLDKKDSLDLFFDTGGTELVLKHSSIRSRTSLLEGKNESYKGENYEPLEGTYALSLNHMNWDSLTIYPTAVGPEDADGHFGWNLFEDKVLEIDYEQERMIVHSGYSGDLQGYAKMDIEYINTLFCIKGEIKIGDKSYVNRYLFDTGFQRAVIMDKDLREKADFPDDLPVLKESKLRNSAGTEFINRVVSVDEICFGNACTGPLPVQLLSTPNPARFKTHILGNELLKRFNTILDFQNNFVYLKPNSLQALPYQDAL